jgi:hypothetical protein
MAAVLAQVARRVMRSHSNTLKVAVGVNKAYLMELLTDVPVIGSIKNEEGLAAVLKSEVRVVFSSQRRPAHGDGCNFRSA